ncbi:ABC transporter substrate-binding protein [Telmatospirillum sp. J64-1]|uniref:ABC transporter substrate-binding protein n=1 Tax=Telmatospirillum sp. J64-1 TaxID=2502183 RepID=UPI00163DD2E7|nr:ABC transporter substrate-binding protein [Telmatospirillum sp. J64-1]
MSGIVQPSGSADRELTIMVFKGVQNLPILAAQHLGFFAKRGLKIDVRIAPNSMELRDGLGAGRYQIVHTAVDNALAMVDHAGHDVAVAMGGDDAFNALYVQPDIESYDDLRGKTIIVDALDTAYALMVYAMLARNGVQRGEYRVESIGATYLRYEALLRRKDYKAGMLSAPYSTMGERAGLKRMDVAVDVIGPYQGTAGFVLKPWAEANKAVLVDYIRSYVEGVRWVLSGENAKEAIRMLAQANEVSEDIAAAAYDIATAAGSGIAEDARLDREAFRNVLKLRAEFAGHGKPASPEKYLDLSYYDEALAGL